ncbi:Threonine synthase-like protein [Pedosphaera parvula Ellin514]|uniref:Threonine synthase-like protein n=1 Tax=Pedosphaera parvula (strain Ellin514) TaxID=320771 RepID=B9XB15_PEDPL|nr:Threonine synthase-like protein [Pedosphaera parvula Ellin514]
MNSQAALKSGPMAWHGVIHRYAKHLPVSATTPIISLNEGNTPLIRVDNFVKAIGGEFELYLKYEGLNPTCSFKDRGMTMAVSKAAERKGASGDLREHGKYFRPGGGLCGAR